MQEEEKKTGISGFVNELNKVRAYPKDPFEHASYMLDTEHAVREFSNIVDKQILLSSISDDNLMRLIQNDVHLLTNMFDMAFRDPDFENVFWVCYNSWRGELMLTRTKDGTERKLQGAVQPAYHPNQQVGGVSLPQQEEDETNLIKNLLNRGKGRR